MKNSMALIFVFLVAGNCAAAEIDLTKISLIESSNNPAAFNKSSGARGQYQITSVCLKEWNAFHPDRVYGSEDLFDPKVNEAIADWYLNKRIPQMLKHYKRADTVENRLIAYNAGIKYVVKGLSLPAETRNYIKKYNRS